MSLLILSRVGTAIICSAIFLFLPFTSYGPQLSIHTLNVGQGDSILIVTPQRHKILIDGGPDIRVINQIETTLPFWDRSIDAIMLTHPDADHVSGLVDVVQRFQIKQAFVSPALTDSEAYLAFKSELLDKHIPMLDFNNRTKIRLADGVVLEGLWPNAEMEWGNDKKTNDFSQVSIVAYKNFTALLTGDIDTNVGEQLLQANRLPDVDFLKVPHHGSRFGFNLEQLSILKPEISVISSGVNNHYGHPAQQTLDILNKIKSHIYRTDTVGGVSVIVDSSGISVATE